MTISRCIGLGVWVLMLGACSTPPKHVGNICAVFQEKSDWYDDAMDAYEKWGVPVSVQMAIIHQESRFRAKARPPRKRFLWVIPTFRPSSAYGYAQILDSTWDWYQDETGNHWADRDDFEDVTDFIGWYVHTSQKTLGISKWDAHRQYLAYHEGHTGFRRKRYRKKTWLLKVAHKVEAQARKYRAQLARCRNKLSRSWW